VLESDRPTIRVRPTPEEREGHKYTSRTNTHAASLREWVGSGDYSGYVDLHDTVYLFVGAGNGAQVVAAGPQAGTTGVQYVYASWSDSGTATYNVTANFTATTYTAGFTTQYYLTTAWSPAAGGTLSPVSGWFTAPLQ
jgi:hypothetical protein